MQSSVLHAWQYYEWQVCLSLVLGGQTILIPSTDIYIKITIFLNNKIWTRWVMTKRSIMRYTYPKAGSVGQCSSQHIVLPFNLLHQP